MQNLVALFGLVETGNLAYLLLRYAQAAINECAERRREQRKVPFLCEADCDFRIAHARAAIEVD